MLSIASFQALVLFSFAIVICSSLAHAMASSKNSSSFIFSSLRVSLLYFLILSRWRFLVSFTASGCWTGVVCLNVLFVSGLSLVDSGLKELVV